MTKEQERAELHRAIWQIANDLRRLFDDIDVNSNKLGATVAKRNEKLVKILDAIGDLKLGRVEANDGNLSVSSYVEQEDTREEVDIAELNRSIAGIVARQQALRAETDKIVEEFGEYRM